MKKKGIGDGPLIDIEQSTHKELLREYKACEDLWSEYSCDCFGFYMSALHKKIVEKGGWPTRK